MSTVVAGALSAGLLTAALGTAAFAPAAAETTRRRPGPRAAGRLVVLLVAAAAVLGSASRAASEPIRVTFFPTAAFWPDNITAGPDGNVWFTDGRGGLVGRVTPAGAVTEFSQGITFAGIGGIAAGPDGNLWFTERSPVDPPPPALIDQIGRITPTGVVTEFSTGITAGSNPFGIAAGPDGNMWFTQNDGWQIGRITPSGAVTEFPAEAITPGAHPTGLPAGIAAGPDGNLWFTQPDDNRIGRISPSGSVTEFTAGITPDSHLRSITAGPDGNLWFPEFGSAGGRIGRITPSGVVTEFPNGPSSGAGGITAGPDGNVWFTAYAGNRIGRITSKGVVTWFETGLPSTVGLGDITTGADRNLWFTVPRQQLIARVTPPPPPKLLAAQARLRVTYTRGRARVASLRVSRLVKGSRVEVRCVRGCAVRKVLLIKTGTWRELAPLFRRHVLPSRTVLFVRITKPDTLGRYFRWTLSGRRLARVQCQVSPTGKLERCRKG